MPRQLRLDAPGTLHHVMVRGIEGSKIFQDEEDRQAFVERINSLVLETGTRILAWALMDNHVRLLIISGPVGLPTFMRRLLTGYRTGDSSGGDCLARSVSGPPGWTWRLKGSR